MPIDPATVVPGTLHIDVAFDWGDEIDLGRAAQLAAAESLDLARRPRTPDSIGYRPAPLGFRLPKTSVELAELGVVAAEAEATVFDFGAVNVRLQASFSLSTAALTSLARSLANPKAIVAAARVASEPLFARLLPAIKLPLWSDMHEEYFVFHLQPGALPAPEQLVSEAGDWLAGIVRLEGEPLSREEIADALRLRISYSPNDLVVIEWAAAIVIDRSCDETLQTIEFANLQLLEYRHIDRRLDDALSEAYGQIHPVARSWMPFWRMQTRPMRMLGDMKIESDMLFERATSALKLMGDQYLARLYRLLATRFHLDEWASSIRGSLDVGQGVYQILADQAAAYRIEVLEIIVIVLIALEIVLAIFRHG